MTEGVPNIKVTVNFMNGESLVWQGTHSNKKAPLLSKSGVTVYGENGWAFYFSHMIASVVTEND